jgi:hypothetical protein
MPMLHREVGTRRRQRGHQEEQENSMQKAHS